jgi:recombinational DNA repair ATPase RecF
MMDKLKNVPKYKKRYNKSYPIQKMQSIRIKNFKSYQSQTIAGLNNRINVILGANGQGKSNFFKGTFNFILAISFLFTDRFTINRNEFNATLYVSFWLTITERRKVSAA